MMREKSSLFHIGDGEAGTPAMKWLIRMIVTLSPVAPASPRVSFGTFGYLNL